MIEVGFLVMIRTLFFLEDSLNQDCFMLLVKDGLCAVLLPSLRMPSMRFLLKGCGRYDSVIAQHDILMVVITIIIFNIERFVSCGLSYRLKLWSSDCLRILSPVFHTFHLKS